MKFDPQPKQTEFIFSPAKQVLFGGGAGGGKTYGLIAIPLIFKDEPNYTAAFFRREKEQFRGPGKLWSDIDDLYSAVKDGSGSEQKLAWQFSSGAALKCHHLQHERDKANHQGGQYTSILYDELTHMTESQFTYLFSRNRNPRCPVPPHVRSTCNPDADSWVRKYVDPFIGEDGYANDMCGKLCWIAFKNEQWVHGWTREEMAEKLSCQPEEVHINASTFTFIPSTVNDNQKLLEAQPDYKALLQGMLDPVEAARLLDGNWNVRYDSGSLFRKENFKILAEVSPSQIKRQIRCWDFAATEQKKGEDPDWTVGALHAELNDGTFCVLDIERFRADPAQVEARVAKQHEIDASGIPYLIEQEPGSSGKMVYHNWANKVLRGRRVYKLSPSGSKVERSRNYSAAVGNGNCAVLKAPWTETLIKEHCAFPSSVWHDDQVDAVCMGYNWLIKQSTQDKRSQRPIPQLL